MSHLHVSGNNTDCAETPHRSELQTLSHSPRDDGRCADGKHKLEQPFVVLVLGQPAEGKQLASNEGVSRRIAVCIKGVPVCKGIAKEEVPCSSRPSLVASICG